MSATSFAIPNCIAGGGSFSAIPPPLSRRSLRVSAAGNSTAERGSQTYSPPETASASSSFYEVLGIQTSATVPEIRSAYRKLARVTHPDIAGGDCGNEFMRVHAAYATLSDPEKRSAYDQSLFRRRMTVVSLGGGYSAAAGPRRRTWETDQCW